MKTISKLVATAALAVSAITGFAQQDQRNLGVSCGCPGLASRTTIDLLAAFPTTTANGIIEFTGDVHLTCDKIYLLSKKVYVPNGKTMTIDPGSLIEGVFNATPDSAACLIIERGGKIMADGKEECNIVFTSNLDPMDGSYSMTNVGKWGGIVICGTATTVSYLLKMMVVLALPVNREWDTAKALIQPIQVTFSVPMQQTLFLQHLTTTIIQGSCVTFR
jgi:hypothetical protein